MTDDGGGQYVLPDIIAAAYDGDVSKVEKLLAEGANVNTLDERDGLSLLHIGCMQGDVDLVKLVLSHDAAHGDVDFDIKSRYRPRLAWQYAMNSNHNELARMVAAADRIKKGLGAPDLEP